MVNFNYVLTAILYFFGVCPFHEFRVEFLYIKLLILASVPGGGTPYNGLYGEAPPERGAFFRLQVYKRVGISQV